MQPGVWASGLMKQRHPQRGSREGVLTAVDVRPTLGGHEITQLLAACQKDDPVALGKLLPLVYDELHRQAIRVFARERAGHTLQPTVLVNEVYLRLVNQREATWQNRAQFFAIASQMMRRILVNHALARAAEKRGGGAEKLSLDEAVSFPNQREIDLIALDEALKELERLDPQQTRIVELRFFGGLSIEEAAEALRISPATVKREWSTARLWLRRQLAK